MELTAAQIANVRQALKQVAGEFQNAFNRGMITEIQQENEKHFIDSEKIIEQSYEKDSRRIKSDEEPCFICRKGIKKNRIKYFVHLLTDGRITDFGSDAMGVESQGYFPIGSECKNKIDSRFITKIEQEF